MRFKLILTAAALIAGCGSDGNNGGGDGGGQDLSASTNDLAAAPLSCTTYCNLIMTNCKGDEATDGGLGQYPNLLSCMHECAQMPVGKSGDTSGDTLGCRTYHATVAANDPLTHCPHAGSTGGGVCGDRCAVFCLRALAVCTTANNVATPYFTSASDCTAKCGTAPFKFDPTLPELVQSGTTLNCAFYHMSEAYADPTTTASDHCNDFDPTNAGRGCQ